MKSRTLSVSIGLLLLLGGCSMHAEFRAGTRSGSSSSGGEQPQPAPQAQAREPQHEHDHDHDHDHDREHGRGDVVRVVRPQSNGDQQSDTGKTPAARDAKPPASSGDQPPRRVGKPAAGAGSWSSVSTPRESTPTVQPPAEGAGAGWSGVGAAADRPAGAADDDGASGAPNGGASAGSSDSPDASAGKETNKREPEPHYSRRRPRKKADKEAIKAEGSDDKQVEQAPAGPKRER